MPRGGSEDRSFPGIVSKPRLPMERARLRLNVRRMRAARLHIVALIIASACMVKLAYAVDPVARPPTMEAMKAAADYSKAQTGQATLVMFDGKVIFEQYDNGGAMEKPHRLA